MAATLRRFDDLDALTRAAADEIGQLAHAAVAARGAWSLAVSGGSTPVPLFELLGRRGRAALPWDRASVWWVDERTVPPDHADSNYRLAREAMLDPLGLDPAQVHRMEGERTDHDAAASDYEAAMVAALGAPPVLDVALMGIGSDGHTASLFPGSAGLGEKARWVIANRVNSPLAGGATTRITLTAPAINAARHVRFLVAGVDKAAALAATLEGPRDPDRVPAQLIATGDLAWLVDATSAASLRGTP